MDEFVARLIIRLGQTRLLDSTRVFERLGNKLKIDFLHNAHYQRGILKCRDFEETGEAFLIREVLPFILPTDPVCFDVGANDGTYSKILQQSFAKASITAFEPHPSLVDSLISEFGKTVSVEATAVGAESGQMELFNSSDGTHLCHGSLHRSVIEDLHHCPNVTAVKVPITTLDQYCKQNSIDRIDFLKIDTEGHELAVLNGAEDLLATGRISAIQFEFNEMNTVSRVFLRDFFRLLPEYRFFRLDTSCLHYLEYHPREELFQIQNIFATLLSVPATCICSTAHRNCVTRY